MRRLRIDKGKEGEIREYRGKGEAGEDNLALVSDTKLEALLWISLL